MFKEFTVIIPQETYEELVLMAGDEGFIAITTKRPLPSSFVRHLIEKNLVRYRKARSRVKAPLKLVMPAKHRPPGQ